MSARGTPKVVPLHRGMPIRQPVDYPERARFATIDDYEASLRGDGPNRPARHIRIDDEPKRGEAWVLIFGASAAFWTVALLYLAGAFG